MSAEGTDIYAIIAIIILIIVGYTVKNPYIKILAYIFVSILLIWRGIIYIQRAVTLSKTFY